MENTNILASLRMAYYYYLMSFGASALFANEEIYDTLEVSLIKTSAYEFGFKEIVDLLREEETRFTLIADFIGIATRTFIKESFERVRKFCINNGCDRQLRNQPWYQYARIVRNCLSHDFILHYNKYDRKILPVSYMNATFTLDMENKNIPSGFCNHHHAFNLFNDMFYFIKSLDVDETT